MTRLSLFTTGTLPLLVLLLSTTKPTSGFLVDLGDVKDIVSLGNDITVTALQSLELIQQGTISNNDQIILPFIKKMEKRLMSQIKNVNDRIDMFQQRLEQNRDEIIDILIRELPKRNQIDRNIADLSKYLGRIDDFHRKFEEYSNSSKKFESFTIQEFAKTCVSSEYGDLPDILLSLHRLIVPNGISSKFEKGLFIQLANNAKVKYINIYQKYFY